MIKPRKVFGLLTIHVFASLWLASEGLTDGDWSPWSSYGSNCSVTCGGGTQMKHRSCTNPAPAGGGLECLQEDNSTRATTETKEFPCNVEGCFANLYTDWDPADPENCTITEVTRKALCGGNDTCTGVQAHTETMLVNLWDKDICEGPCEKQGVEKVKCPVYGLCKDISTEEEPLYECICTMGYKMNSEGTGCIRPPPTQPTRRPIPTLPEAQKIVATVVSKTASSLLIIFVGITLTLFCILRIFTIDRIIQMNMEIALICAHIFLMFPVKTYEVPTLCRFVSICIHFFFTACYMFMMLEALHMYSLVAHVVKKDGMLSKMQNILVGWGVSFVIILFCVCFEYDDYGGEYHCWLQMDTPLWFGQLLPLLMITIVTLTLIEAAGAAEYRPLKGMDDTQLLSAKISQRTNLIILPFVVAHMLVGMLSEYEQNLPLYGIFSILNGFTGGLVFFLHCSNNQQVRAKLKGCFNKMRNRSSK